MSQSDREIAKRAIQAYLNGDDSPEGKRLFEQWYASFPDNEASAMPADPDGTAERLWQRIAQQTFQQNESGSDQTQTRLRQMPLHPWRSGWMVAATVMLVCLATAAWFMSRSAQRSTSPAAYNERVNRAGQRAVVRLPDGSVVYLNAASRLRFPQTFAHNRREVWLTGEAFFEVKRHPKQPFVVQTGSLQTTVLGTSFTVRAYPNEAQIEVAVVTGKVRVAGAVASALLTPNRLATYQRGTGALVTTTLRDARERMAWTTGRLVFERQKFSDIIRVLERHYGVTITLKNGRLAHYVLNADFNNEPLTQVLDLLCGYMKTSYQRSGRDIVIGR